MAEQKLGGRGVVYGDFAGCVDACPRGTAALSLAAYLCHAAGYMFHQVEEHVGDRFRIFVNQHVFHGVEALTPLTVLWINLPGVWGIGLLSIYAASFFSIGWGLSIVYLVLVNAVAHMIGAILWREYNPGLWTALILFLPLGTLALFQIAGVPGVAPVHHAAGITVALAIHAAIVVHTRGRAAKVLRQRVA